MAEKDEYIGEAYELLKNLNADEKKRIEYEYRKKALKDYNTQILSYEQRGREEGRKEGEARLAKLIELLNANGRSDEIIKVVSDVSYREKLLEEFEL